MTVSAETNHVSYEGDDATSEFAFTFKIFEEADLKVVITDPEGTDHTLPYDIYSYTLTGELGKFESGGTVSLFYDNEGSMDPWLLPSGYTITISLAMEYTQPVDLIYGGRYSSEAIEKMVDRVVKMIQQLAVLIGTGGGGGGNGESMGAWGNPVQITLVSGVATVPGSGYYSLDTEGGAASDDLVRVLGLSAGDQVIFKAESSARTIVAKHGEFLKLNTGADFTLDNKYDRLVLQCEGANVCVELGGRTSGGA